MPYLLTARTSIPLGIARVFDFFANAANLDRLTPPWLHLRVDTPPPIAMAPGSLIDYRLRLHGIPIRWRTEITEWNPPHGFVDEQRHGPYRWWIHTHTFNEAPDGAGTDMEDIVDYQPRGGALVHALLVGRDLRRIFAWRAAALRAALDLPPDGSRPRIVIARR